LKEEKSSEEGVLIEAACKRGRPGAVLQPAHHHRVLPADLHLEAQEGRLFAPLAWTKTFSMAAAAILSVTLVPALMVIFVRGQIRSRSTRTRSTAF
jgi:hypothetical protein